MPVGTQPSWDHLAFREYVISHAKGLGLAESTADLARASGLGRSMLSKWFSGTERPSPASLERLAKAIGVPPLELLTRAGWVGQSGAGTQEQPAPPQRDQTVAKLERLLADPKLSEEERDLLRGLVERVLVGWEPKRNGRRRSA